MDKLQSAEAIVAVLEGKNPKALFLDPKSKFNSALVGVAPAYEDRRWERDNKDVVAVYSEEKCIEAMIAHDGMDYEMAQEYYYFNIEGSFMGDGTPIFISDEG